MFEEGVHAARRAGPVTVEEVEATAWEDEGAEAVLQVARVSRAKEGFRGSIVTSNGLPDLAPPSVLLSKALVLLLKHNSSASQCLRHVEGPEKLRRRTGKVNRRCQIEKELFL